MIYLLVVLMEIAVLLISIISYHIIIITILYQYIYDIIGYSILCTGITHYMTYFIILLYFISYYITL